MSAKAEFESPSSPWVIWNPRHGSGGALFSSGIGIVLSIEGWKVNIVDLKDGYPTLHSYFNRDPSPVSLEEMMNRGEDVRNLVKGTDLSFLWFLSGSKEKLDEGSIDVEGILNYLSPIIRGKDMVSIVYCSILRECKKSSILRTLPYGRFSNHTPSEFDLRCRRDSQVPDSVSPPYDQEGTGRGSIRPPLS